MDDRVEQPFIEPREDATPPVTNNPTDPKRLDDLEDLVKAVFVVIIIAVGALVVSVGALILDQQHFNDEFYRQATGQKTVTKTQTVIIKQPLIRNSNN